MHISRINNSESKSSTRKQSQNFNYGTFSTVSIIQTIEPTNNTLIIVSFNSELACKCGTTVLNSNRESLSRFRRN